MDTDFQNLEDLFSSDPSKAITECENIICSVANFDSYKDFYNYHLENAHISTCQNEWSSPELCIFCRNCCLVKNACICLSCFLNGNHEGHDYAVLTSIFGNCDCGDTELWKRSGFCKKHQGLDEDNNHPEDYLDEKLQTVLTDIIFKAAFSSLRNYTNKDTEKADNILQYISSFLKFGDGFRRLIARSLTEKIDFKSFLSNVINYSTEFNRSLQQLCGGLINDQLFIRNYSKICYDVVMNSLMKDSYNVIVNSSESITYEVWNEFLFHCFSEKIVEYNVFHEKWDWVHFFIEVLSYFREVLLFIGNDSYSQIPTICVTVVYRIAVATELQPNEETQLFFDEVVTKLLASKSPSQLLEGQEINANVITSFKETTEKKYFFPAYQFSIFFYLLFDGFKNKPNLKFDKLFDELNKTVEVSQIFLIGKNSIGKNSSNDNDKFVLSYLQNDSAEPINPSNYKSFHNGGAFYVINPLYESLSSLFNLDLISKIKIAKFLALEENQALRIKLSIIAMKRILSYICHRQSIDCVNNKGIDLFYNILDQPSLCSNFFPKYFPLFQFLFGLKCKSKSLNEEFSLKEFFAFECAREIGLFDDFESVDYKDENVGEKQKAMVFSFLYLSLLLVIERTLFHFNGRKFVEEQLIFALKNGVHSIDKLNKLYDNTVFDSHEHLFEFNDVLMKIAKAENMNQASQNNRNENDNDDDDDDDEQQEANESSKSFQQDVSFYLKDGVEWKSISAINSINTQMTLMNNEISKKADSLLKIPSFEPEEEFFFPQHPERKEEASNGNTNDNDNGNGNNNNENNDNNNNNDNDNDNNSGDDVLAGFDSSDLHVNLKQFLMTPTVLSVVYHTLRTSAGNDSPTSDINDHLAMNILILVSRFIKESNLDTQIPPLQPSTIRYKSLSDLIAKTRSAVFKYHADGLLNKIFRIFKRSNENDNKNATIENTLNSINFVAFLNTKFSTDKLPPKSFIEVLLEKGKLGRFVLEQISQNVHLDCFENEEKQNKKPAEDVKEMKHKRAAKLKEDIMNHYKNMIANYSASNQRGGTDSIDDIGAVSNSEPLNFEKEVCSICSTYKKNEIFSYPLYIYRTKFPFVIDKPPLFNVDEIEDSRPIDDSYDDFFHDPKEEELLQENEKENDDEGADIDPDFIMQLIEANFPNLLETEGLNQDQIAERRNVINYLFNSLMQRQLVEVKARKAESNFRKEFLKMKKDESDQYKLALEKVKEKRFTAGSNFCVQFGICQHAVHPNCVQDKFFPCPIDRSVRNGLLPSIDEIPKSVVFKDLKTFEINKEENSLAESVIQSITSFIDNFTSFFTQEDENRSSEGNESNENDANNENDENENNESNANYSNNGSNENENNENESSANDANNENSNENENGKSGDSAAKVSTVDVFVELIKSISGLISTYEIRLRSLPDCLDSEKSLLLPRNLFLTAWYAYRIRGKPKISIPNHDEVDVESRLTPFQLFVKKMIEDDEIEDDMNGDRLASIASSIVNAKFEDKNFKDSAHKEKEVLLFLRRVSLSDYFLLNNKSNSDALDSSVLNNIIDWDEILLPSNLAKKFKVEFKELDDEIEFKPFIFSNLPKEFLRLSQPPFNLPIKKCEDLTFFNLIDYNYLINNFDDFEGEIKPKNDGEFEKDLSSCVENNVGSFFDQFFCRLHFPSVLLFIGKYESQIFVIDQDFFGQMNSFYIDKYGCPDIGFKRGQPLFLNEERYEKCIDMILSGDFSNTLIPVNRLKDS